MVVVYGYIWQKNQVQEKKNSKKIIDYLANEKKYGILKKSSLFKFYTKLENEKYRLKKFFKKIRVNKVYGYGAPAKAVTLINYFKNDYFLPSISWMVFFNILACSCAIRRFR